jgi:serine phosphatase RsbU (regulator of sigma subunit)
LLPGELLCLMTDGVVEAQTPDGRLYGNDRLQQRLQELMRRGASARDVVDSLRADVGDFAAGAEAADDLTILALRWNGPRGAAA